MSAKVKTVRVLFFRPNCADKKLKFVDQLIFSQKNSELVQDGDGFAVFIKNLNRDANGIWTGELFKKRTEDFPVKLDKKNAATELSFDDDEGLGESTAFLYYEAKNAIAFMRNSHVGTENTLSRFLGFIAKGVEFDMNTIVKGGDPEVILKGMGAIKRFEVSLACPPQSNSAPAANGQAERLQGMFAQFGAKTVHILIGSDRGEANLNPKEIKDLALDVSKKAKSGAIRVSKIRVTGAADDDHKFELLDLIENKLEEYEDLTITKKTIPYSTKRKAVERAFESRRTEL